jgi:hypothetical protein
VGRKVVKFTPAQLAHFAADSPHLLSIGVNDYYSRCTLCARSEAPSLTTRSADLQRKWLHCQRLVQRAEPCDVYKPLFTVPIISVHVGSKDGVCLARVARTLWGRILSARTAVGGPPTLKIRAGVAQAPLGRFPSQWNRSPRVIKKVHVHATTRIVNLF